MVIQDKREIRRVILQQRESIKAEIRNEWDRSIFLKLINSDFYKKARVIFTFVSFGSEVDTQEIIKKAFEDSKILYAPKIESKEKGIKLYRINSLEDLETGYFGILEPSASCQAVEGNDIDLILMPGVAFDRYGGRVGYGKGFYDRFLRTLDKDIDKVALAYDFQILEKVPMEEFDVEIDSIISNKRIIFKDK